MKKIAVKLLVLIAIVSGAVQVLKFLYPLGLENHPSIKMEVNDGSMKVDWKDTGMRGTGYIISQHSLGILSRWKQGGEKHLSIELEEIGSGRKRLVSYFSAFVLDNQKTKTIIWETGHDWKGSMVVISLFLIAVLTASVLTVCHVSRSP